MNNLVVRRTRDWRFIPVATYKGKPLRSSERTEETPARAVFTPDGTLQAGDIVMAEGCCWRLIARSDRQGGWIGVRVPARYVRAHLSWLPTELIPTYS